MLFEFTTEDTEDHGGLHVISSVILRVLRGSNTQRPETMIALPIARRVILAAVLLGRILGERGFASVADAVGSAAEARGSAAVNAVAS